MVLHAVADHLDRPESSYLDLLTAATRPEFAGDVIVARKGDAVLYGIECEVGWCDRPAHKRRSKFTLCDRHRNQTVKLSLEQIPAWLTTPPEQGGPSRDFRPDPCRICRRASMGRGLCGRCKQAFGRHPDLSIDEFVATWRPRPSTLPECLADECDFEAPHKGLCDYHYRRFKRFDGPLDDYLEWLLCERSPRYVLTGLPPVLAAELRLWIQIRSDDGHTRLTPELFRGVKRALLVAGVASVLDVDMDDAHAAQFRWHNHDRRRSDIRFMQHRLPMAVDDVLGIDERTRDVWRLDRLEPDAVLRGNRGALDFTFIPEVWARELVKRWFAVRSSSRNWATLSRQLTMLTYFWQYLSERGIVLHGPASTTRDILESFVPWVFDKDLATGYRRDICLTVRQLLTDARRYGFVDGLRPEATIYEDELPREKAPPPRPISTSVWEIITRPASLDLIDDQEVYTLVRLLMEIGLRGKDATQLPIDALEKDADGKPYIRWFNHKTKREYLAPISDDLADIVRAQQEATRQRFPFGHRVLKLCAAPSKNPDGSAGYRPQTLRTKIYRWLEACGVGDSDLLDDVPNADPGADRRRKLTPHRFRHTVATLMVNDDVPLTAIQQLLGHESGAMTHRYAKLHDRTLRREFDAHQQRLAEARGVTAADTALEDARWARERMDRAKMALPNGFCGRPLTQTCEIPTACMTCAHFLPDPAKRPVFATQLAETDEFITTARAAGNERWAQVNEDLKISLIQILEQIDADAEAEAA